MADLQKKLSVTRLLGGKMTAAKVAKAGGKLLVGRFMGVAVGTKEGVTDYGEWQGLVGHFRGVNATTGETMDATTCFLPDVVMPLITTQLAQGALSVEFAFDVSAIADEASPVGFSYIATPVLQVGANDPLAQLEGKIKALAAPKAPEGGEDVTAEKAKAKK